MKHNSLLLISALALLCACSQMERFSISSDDTTAPGSPFFVDSKPLPGGARIFFIAPDDEDILSVAATWKNASGQDVIWTASYFTDSLDVYGFPSEGEQFLSLYSIDRAGNTSPRQEIAVVTGEPPLVTLGNSIRLIPSFESFMVGWENPTLSPLYVYVDISFGEKSFTRAFSTAQGELRTLDGIRADDTVPVSVRVRTGDKYGNEFTVPEQTLHLLTDQSLPKEGWKLLEGDAVMGGAVEAIGDREGGYSEFVIDSKTEADGSFNYFCTDAANPWNIIIDLGESCCLSRILTHQRYSGYQYNDLQGLYYRGDNVMAYNLYIWDADKAEWEFCSRHDIVSPIVKQQADYKTRGDEGDQAFFYPDEPGFTPPTQYLRFEAISGKYISEISLFGKINNE